jgi:hypothetical protein
VVDLWAGPPSEQDVQLGESEDEAVVLIDQGHADGTGQRLRQSGGELQTTEPGAQDDDVFRHR